MTGLRVPQDVSIAGFDDDAMFRLLTPALTTGRVDGAEFGAKAVRLILNRLQGARTGGTKSACDLKAGRAPVHRPGADRARLTLYHLEINAMQPEPICLHPENPHIFLFRGQPTLLITSAEHYGAVVNLDFDYAAYLDVLAAYGLITPGFTPGAYRGAGPLLYPRKHARARFGRHCLPWGRSGQPGYPSGREPLRPGQLERGIL